MMPCSSSRGMARILRMNPIARSRLRDIVIFRLIPRPPQAERWPLRKGSASPHDLTSAPANGESLADHVALYRGADVHGREGVLGDESEGARRPGGAGVAMAAGQRGPGDRRPHGDAVER